MLNKILGVSSKIYLIVIVTLLSILGILSIYINYLNGKIETQQNKIIQANLQYEILSTDLKNANDKIKQKEKEYQEWKDKKPEVKYKTIIKWKERIKDATCEEKVKAIADINYNDL